MIRDGIYTLWAQGCRSTFYTGYWLYLCKDPRRYSLAFNDWDCNLRCEWITQNAFHLVRSLGYAPPDAKRHSDKFAEWFCRHFPRGIRIRVDGYSFTPIRVQKRVAPKCLRPRIKGKIWMTRQKSWREVDRERVQTMRFFERYWHYGAPKKKAVLA